MMGNFASVFHSDDRSSRVNWLVEYVHYCQHINCSNRKGQRWWGLGLQFLRSSPRIHAVTNWIIPGQQAKPKDYNVSIFYGNYMFVFSSFQLLHVFFTKLCHNRASTNFCSLHPNAMWLWSLFWLISLPPSHPMYPLPGPNARATMMIWTEWTASPTRGRSHSP